MAVRNRTFLDSGAIFSFADRSDPDHGDVLECYSDSKRHFVTHEAILLEAFSLLTKRASKSHAIRVIGAVRASYRIEIYPVAPYLESAWAMCLKYEDKEWDWIDCLSFTIMRQLEIAQALTLDRHFQQAGFRVIPH